MPKLLTPLANTVVANLHYVLFKSDCVPLFNLRGSGQIVNGAGGGDHSPQKPPPPHLLGLQGGAHYSPRRLFVAPREQWARAEMPSISTADAHWLEVGHVAAVMQDFAQPCGSSQAYPRAFF